jgi:hypothetical protein
MKRPPPPGVAWFFVFSQVPLTASREIKASLDGVNSLASWPAKGGAQSLCGGAATANVRVSQDSRPPGTSFKASQEFRLEVLIS